ncbi:hypothetical protein Peetri_00142 [Pseudomonas phage vB_PpuM-Peetri]
MPQNMRAPVYGYARTHTFTLIPGKGQPTASFTGGTCLLRDSFFTEPKAWATLLHECTHALLEKEGTTLQQLRSGDLLLSLLGQNPQDPKFNEWRKGFTYDNPAYATTIQNGKLLMQLLGLKLKNFDVYPFGNYYEAVPGMVELYARGYTKRWPEQVKPYVKWCMQRFADIDTIPI